MDGQEDCFHLGVKALIYNREGNLLLLKVNTLKLKHTKAVYWDIPGGRIQKNESLMQALMREVYEETGIEEFTSISTFSMVLSSIRIPTQAGDVGLVLAAYKCDIESNVSIKISDEHIDFAWFEPEEAAQLLSTKYPAEFIDKLTVLQKI